MKYTLTDLALKIENDLQIDFKRAKELSEYFLKLYGETYKIDTQNILIDVLDDFCKSIKGEITGNSTEDTKFINETYIIAEL